MGGECDTYGGNENLNKFFAGKFQRKRPRGRFKHTGRIILKCILKKTDVKFWSALN
jgi:hypothetical protein